MKALPIKRVCQAVAGRVRVGQGGGGGGWSATRMPLFDVTGGMLSSCVMRTLGSSIHARKQDEPVCCRQSSGIRFVKKNTTAPFRQY